LSVRRLARAHLPLLVAAIGVAIGGLWALMKANDAEVDICSGSECTSGWYYAVPILVGRRHVGCDGRRIATAPAERLPFGRARDLARASTSGRREATPNGRPLTAGRPRESVAREAFRAEAIANTSRRRWRLCHHRPLTPSASGNFDRSYASAKSGGGLRSTVRSTSYRVTGAPRTAASEAASRKTRRSSSTPRSFLR
jgi:hypothetical protein